jgi:hypothetical protein
MYQHMSYILTLRVPDEGYSEGTWWRLFWGYLMKVILRVPDEGYSEGHLMKVIPETRSTQ